jgi:hypothetical protein
MSGELPEIDWSLATWEGSCAEQRRRWAALSLEEILAAQEEMQKLSEELHREPLRSNEMPDRAAH